MSTAENTTGAGSALVMFLVAALIVGGAVAGFLLAGMAGFTAWFVILTFLILGLMVVVSIP